MGVATLTLLIEHNAPIPTRFAVGGPADRLAHPADIEQLAACIELDPDLKVLGSGANLLVDDPGVSELVVSLDTPAFKRIHLDPETCSVRAGAGVDLARLMLDCQRAGLAGLEKLAGVPASLAGAVRMNAGGSFGEIGPLVSRVRGFDRDANPIELLGTSIPFAYRASGLDHIIITEVELTLTRDDPPAIRDRLLAIMREKKASQPLAERSAGCCFKNPIAPDSLDHFATPGKRISAGLLIDRAACKGLRLGGSQVSARHANFITAEKGSSARDAIALIDQVQQRVADAFDIHLQTEVVIWKRTP